MSSWAVFQPQLPDSVTLLAEVLNSLIDALLAILEIVRAVLDVVKALLIGFLDPIRAIIEAIVAEIEGLLNDIKQIGVYFSGDLNVEPPFNDLLGGFTAYERRMIARLVDRTDPTRPAFSSRSACVAVFLYGSFDASTINQVLAFLSLIRKFFGLRGKTRAYTIPVGLNVSYGSSTTGFGAFSLNSDILDSGQEPTVANVKWQMAPPPGTGQVSWPLPCPPGFLIEVSTIPDGLTLTYKTPVAQAQMDGDGNQHTTVGLVFDPEGQPFKLYGGPGIIESSDLSWSQNGTTFTPPSGDGKTQLFAYRSSTDNVPIPINALVIDGKPILQRTFFVNVLSVLGVNLAAPGQQFSTVLNYADMPYDATFEDAGNGAVSVTVGDEPSREVYVRVSAVSKDVVAGSGVFDPSSFFWTIDQGRIEAGAGGVVQLGVTPNISAKGDPSSSLKVTFPSAQMAAYLETVATCLAIMVLSRSDLIAQGTVDVSFQIDSGGEPTGLEDIAQYLIPKLIGESVGRFLKRNFHDVSSFRGNLRKKCRATANYLLEQTGQLPAEVIDLVLSQAMVTTATGVTKALSDVTWNDLNRDYDVNVSILDSLNPATDGGSNPYIGIGPNPVSIGALRADSLEWRIGSDIDLVRMPGFLVPSNYATIFEDSTGIHARMSAGSADYSPVLYRIEGSSIEMEFCRNIFLANPSVLTACALVLNVAAAPLARVRKPGGEWIAYRLFPQGLPPVEAMLNEIIGFLNAITAGLDGILEAIVAYINFIEARILELEALLRRIQALLNLILSIEVPAAAGLVVTGNGTDGILQALVSADNKPLDSSTIVTRIDEAGNTKLGGTYGAGVVLLAGGLPASVLDLLLLMFQSQ